MPVELSQASSATNAPHRGVVDPVRLGAVALPAEHGGWGMLGEPLLLGLLVAPSWAGFGVGIAAAFAFLARHPLKLVLADARARRRNARTVAALHFVLVYGAVAFGGMALASGGANGWWLPLGVAAPLALLQLAHDLREQGRQLLPELLGAVALGAIAAAELVAGGWGLAPAFAAWGLVALKAIGAILYVRARVRCDRGLAFRRSPVLAAHALAAGAAGALAASLLAPWTAILAFGVLLARAAFGLSRYHRKARPQVVGILELAHGVSFVLLIAAGYLAPRG